MHVFKTCIVVSEILMYTANVLQIQLMYCSYNVLFNEARRLFKLNVFAMEQCQ